MLTDRAKIVAIQVMGRFLTEEVAQNSYDDYVVAKINGVFVCRSDSCNHAEEGRGPAYWWNVTLSTLRAACLRARRRAQKARNEAEREERRIEPLLNVKVG